MAIRTRCSRCFGTERSLNSLTQRHLVSRCAAESVPVNFDSWATNEYNPWPAAPLYGHPVPAVSLAFKVHHSARSELLGRYERLVLPVEVQREEETAERTCLVPHSD